MTSADPLSHDNYVLPFLPAKRRFALLVRLKPELRARCKRFGSSAIRLYVQLPRERSEVRILAQQLIRSATSVGAHAREASRARSGAEFSAKINGLLQEADESQLWLEYLGEDCGITAELTQPIWREADELIAVFVAISNALQNGEKPR